MANFFEDSINRRRFLTAGGCAVLGTAMGCGWTPGKRSFALLEERGDAIRADSEDLLKILKRSMKTGADFAELFFERNVKKCFAIRDRKAEPGRMERIEGTGLRLFKGSQMAYGWMKGFERSGLETLSERVRKQLIPERSPRRPKPMSVQPDRHFGIVPTGTDLNRIRDRDREDIALRAFTAARESSNLLDRIEIRLEEEIRQILIANSLGLFRTDTQPLLSLTIRIRARSARGEHWGERRLSMRKGFEIFDGNAVETLAAEAVQESIQMCQAEELPEKYRPVILAAGSGARLLQETIGQAIRGDLIPDSRSFCAGALNQQVAFPGLNVVDNGTCIYGRGSSHFDDEGTETGHTRLIQGGRLVNYLVDYTAGRQLNLLPTGNARRSSFRNPPCICTTNLYIGAGRDRIDQMLSETPGGVFCRNFDQVEIDVLTGDFTAVTREAYRIENGRPGRALHRVMLRGNALDFLDRIDRVADRVLLTPGDAFCQGSDREDRIPVSFGQPDIRVSYLLTGTAGRQAERNYSSSRVTR
ncbi:TldD/PmbA family protein [bacterium]|nr:TldD/PmbA family protein [candidate division CSSED10-310 bacterium]